MFRSFLRTFFLAVVLAIFLFVLTGCLRTSEDSVVDTEEDLFPKPEETDTITIGAIGPLTGDGAAYGIPMQYVSEIAREKVNQDGGINGKFLEFIWEDAKCNGKDAASAVQKLINIDKVKIILGGLCSSETLGAAPIAEEAGIVVVSGASSSPDITNAGDYIFRTYPSDSSQGEILANIALDLGFTKAGMLTEENDYTIGIAEVFKEVFEAGGGTVLDERFLPTDTDFRTQILRLKDANVEFIFVNPQTPPKADLVFKQIQEQIIEMQLFANDVIFGWQEGLDRYAELVEGMIGAEASYEKNHPEFLNLVEEYTMRTEKEAIDYPTYSATTYDAVMIIAEALREVGHDADAVKEYLYGISDRPGLAGVLTIDENGDPISGHIAKVIIQGNVELYEQP